MHIGRTLPSSHPNCTLDVIVIGGGQSGICLSYFLNKNHIQHKVIEKGRPFSSWYGRWDTFYLNTANWMNYLPGLQREFVPGKPVSALASKDDAIAYFEAYLRAVDPPIQPYSKVTRVYQDGDKYWYVDTSQMQYKTKAVAVCIGAYSVPKIPALADRGLGLTQQLHSSQYRNPEQMNSANILIVGSGSSGVQICADIAGSMRFKRVYLATSNNINFPWKILGLPIHTLVRLSKTLDVKSDSWLGKQIVKRAVGRGAPATPPSPMQLKKRYGVTLLGKVKEVNDRIISFTDGSTLPIYELSIIWCTGYYTNHDFIKLPNKPQPFDNKTSSVYQCGVMPVVPGLYFLGLPFQSTLASHILYGIGRDAEYVANHITDFLQKPL